MDDWNDPNVESFDPRGEEPRPLLDISELRSYLNEALDRLREELSLDKNTRDFEDGANWALDELDDLVNSI